MFRPRLSAAWAAVCSAAGSDPPWHWRYAFVTASLLVLTTSLAAVVLLPAEQRPTDKQANGPGFVQLMLRPDLAGPSWSASAPCLLRLHLQLPALLSEPAPYFPPIPVHHHPPLPDLYRRGDHRAPVRKIQNHFGNGLTTVLGSLTLGAGLRQPHPPSRHGGRQHGPGLRRLLRRARLGRGRHEPPPPDQPRTGQLAVYPLVLRGGIGRDHRHLDSSKSSGGAASRARACAWSRPCWGLEYMKRGATGLSPARPWPDRP